MKWRAMFVAVAGGALVIASAGSAAVSGRVERLNPSDNALAFRIGIDAGELGARWTGRLDVEADTSVTERCEGLNLDPSVSVTGRTSGRFNGPRYDLDATVEVLKSTAQVRTEWSAWAGRPAYPACLARVFVSNANLFRETVRLLSARTLSLPKMGDRSRVVEIRYIRLRDKTERVIVNGFVTVSRAEFSPFVETSRALRTAALASVVRAGHRFERRASGADELRR
jgi:hypothetical protein